MPCSHGIINACGSGHYSMSHPASAIEIWHLVRDADLEKKENALFYFMLLGHQHFKNTKVILDITCLHYYRFYSESLFFLHIY